MACQPAWGWYMPHGYLIAHIVYVYLQFYVVSLLNITDWTISLKYLIFFLSLFTLPA